MIKGHNKTILSEPEKPSPDNCTDKTSCPLNGSCQHKNPVYSCRVLSPVIKQNHPHYIGFTEDALKDRIDKHNNSFKYESKRNPTELSNLVLGKKRRVKVNLGEF